MNVTGVYSDITAGSSVSSDKSVLDKDAFLRLLSTQLQYQDPFNSQDNNQFMTQMTQFAMLEQLQNINILMAGFCESQEQAQAVSLLGREVLVKAADDSVENGVIQSVKFTTEGPMFTVNGSEYYLYQVQEIQIEDQLTDSVE